MRRERDNLLSLQKERVLLESYSIESYSYPRHRWPLLHFTHSREYALLSAAKPPSSKLAPRPELVKPLKCEYASLYYSVHSSQGGDRFSFSSGNVSLRKAHSLSLRGMIGQNVMITSTHHCRTVSMGTLHGKCRNRACGSFYTPSAAKVPGRRKTLRRKGLAWGA